MTAWRVMNPNSHERATLAQSNPKKTKTQLASILVLLVFTSFIAFLNLLFIAIVLLSSEAEAEAEEEEEADGKEEEFYKYRGSLDSISQQI